MTLAFVALGANLGDARGMLERAMRTLDGLPSTRLAAHSSLYRSAPVDTEGPDFINAVVALETTLEPEALLLELQRVEREEGRERSWHNAPRTLDLDLLLHGEACRHTATLTLPHPRMNQRAFVLRPLAEIAPMLVDQALLDEVRDQAIEKL